MVYTTPKNSLNVYKNKENRCKVECKVGLHFFTLLTPKHMKAKEYVLSLYPNANSIKVNRNGPFKEFYWLIFKDYIRTERLAEGEDNKGEGTAWVLAKNNIKEATK